LFYRASPYTHTSDIQLLFIASNLMRGGDSFAANPHA
jgi:hypothetical protein